MGTYEEIIALLKSDDEISCSQVAEWMKSDDLRVLEALYRVISVAYNRIKPELGMESSCELILNYLTRCIVENPQRGDYLYGRYQAGLIMSAWIKQLWNTRPETEKVIEKVRDTLAEIYLCGDSGIQECIVSTILENVFVDKDMITIFKSWEKREYLRDAYDLALKYAKKRSEEIPDSVIQDILGTGKG